MYYMSSFVKHVLQRNQNIYACVCVRVSIILDNDDNLELFYLILVNTYKHASLWLRVKDNTAQPKSSSV